MDKILKENNKSVMEFESSTPLSHNAKKRLVIPDIFSPVVNATKKQPKSKIPRIVSTGGAKNSPLEAAGPSQVPVAPVRADENFIAQPKAQHSDDVMMIAVSDDSDDDIFGPKKKKKEKKGSKIVERSTGKINVKSKVPQKKVPTNVSSNKKRMLMENSDSEEDERPIQRKAKLQKVSHPPDNDSADDEDSDDQHVINETFDVPTKKSAKAVEQPKTASKKNSPSKAISIPLPVSTGSKPISPIKSKVQSPVKQNQKEPHTPTKSPLITKKDLFVHSPRASDIQIKSPSKKTKNITAVKKKLVEKLELKSPTKTSPNKVTLTKSIAKTSNSNAVVKVPTKVTNIEKDSDNESIFGDGSCSKLPRKSIIKSSAQRKIVEKQAVQPDDAIPGTSSEYNYPPIETNEVEMRLVSSEDESHVEFEIKKTSKPRKQEATKINQQAGSPKKKESTQTSKKQSKKGKGSNAEASTKIQAAQVNTSSFSETHIDTPSSAEKKPPAKKRKRKSLCMPKRKTKSVTSNKSITPQKTKIIKKKVNKTSIIEKPQIKRNILNDIDGGKKTQKLRNDTDLVSETVTKKGEETKSVAKKTAGKKQTKNPESLVSETEAVPEKGKNIKSVPKKTSDKKQTKEPDSELDSETEAVPEKGKNIKSVPKKTSDKQQTKKPDSETEAVPEKGKNIKSVPRKTSDKQKTKKPDSETEAVPEKGKNTKSLPKKTSDKKQTKEPDSETEAVPEKGKNTKSLPKKPSDKKQTKEPDSELDSETEAVPEKGKNIKSVPKKTSDKQQTNKSESLVSENMTKKAGNVKSRDKKTAKKQESKKNSLLSSEEYQEIYSTVFGSNAGTSEGESSSTANITVVEKKKKSDTSGEAQDDGTRRSKRVRAPPLAYWAGEKMRVVESEKGEEEYEFVIHANADMPKQKNPVPAKIQSKQPVHPSVDKFLQRMAAAMDKDEESRNDDSNVIPETMIRLALDPNHPKVQSECQIISHVQDIIPLSKNAGTEKQDDGLRYATTLQCPWLDCGYMRLNPGVSKGRQLALGRVLTFMVLSSEVEVEICENKSILKFGYTFVVPPGVTYNITNCGRQPALLSYQSIHHPHRLDKETTNT